MHETRMTKLKSRWKAIFETKKDILTAVVIVLFIFFNVLKISLFNHMLVPDADKWMLRYKFLKTLLVVLITYPILFRFKSRILFVSFYMLQTLYILLNLGYYFYFQDYLHIEQVLSNFYEGFTAVRNASAPNNPLMAVVLIDLPFAIYLALSWFRANRLRNKLKVLIYIVALASLSTLIVTEYRQYKEKNFLTHISQNLYVGETRMVQRYGTLLNNAAILLNKKSMEEQINSFEYGREQVNDKEADQKANIFMIQVESLDASIVGLKHSGQYVMPYLSSLTDKSVYYPYMLSYHFAGSTSDCEFSVINSVEALERYPSIKLTTYKSPNSFVTRLKQASYTTYAFHGNEGKFYDRNLAFRRFGFDEFYDMIDMNLKHVGWGAPDADVFRFALEKSKEITGPFLSYIITMTSHGPFNSASNYYNNPNYDDITDKKVKQYYNSMSYVDESIESFVQSVKKEYDNAYIFIFGDHTPKIESSEYVQADVMMEDKIHEFVPFFIITPDNRAYRESKIVASFLDIAPTALYASGISFSIRSDGSNLLEPGGEHEKIPHRHTRWDRAQLYEIITRVLKDRWQHVNKTD